MEEDIPFPVGASFGPSGGLKYEVEGGSLSETDDSGRAISGNSRVIVVSPSHKTNDKDFIAEDYGWPPSKGVFVSNAEPK